MGIDCQRLFFEKYIKIFLQAALLVALFRSRIFSNLAKCPDRNNATRRKCEENFLHHLSRVFRNKKVGTDDEENFLHRLSRVFFEKNKKNYLIDAAPLSFFLKFCKFTKRHVSQSFYALCNAASATAAFALQFSARGSEGFVDSTFAFEKQ